MSLPSYYLVYSHQLLHHSSVVVRTHPQAITLGMITMRKSTHGFPFASHMGMGAKMAVYWVVPEKIRTPDRWDSGNSCGRGGQRPWKSRQEGGQTTCRKSLLQGSFLPIVHAIRTFSSVTLEQHSRTQKNSRDILFTYFSPNINDNLS